MNYDLPTVALATIFWKARAERNQPITRLAMKGLGCRTFRQAAFVAAEILEQCRANGESLASLARAYEWGF